MADPRRPVRADAVVDAVHPVRQGAALHHGCDGTLEENNLDDSGKRWPTATEPDAHGLGEVVQSLRSLWYYHQDVYTFHTHFLNCSTHTYASKPSGWLLLNRPVGVAADTGIEPGTRGCDAPAGSNCLEQVLLIGTPTIWWGGMPGAAVRRRDVGRRARLAVRRRRGRHGVDVAALAALRRPADLLLLRDRRAALRRARRPLAIGKLVGRSDVPTPRRTAGVVVAGSYVVLVLLDFAWFWPIWTDQLLTRSEWLDRIWFQRWI